MSAADGTWWLSQGLWAPASLIDGTSYLWANRIVWGDVATALGAMGFLP
jgi:hypothetical protein